MTQSLPNDLNEGGDERDAPRPPPEGAPSWHPNEAEAIAAVQKLTAYAEATRAICGHWPFAVPERPLALQYGPVGHFGPKHQSPELREREVRRLLEDAVGTPVQVAIPHGCTRFERGPGSTPYPGRAALTLWGDLVLDRKRAGFALSDEVGVFLPFQPVEVIGVIFLTVQQTPPTGRDLRVVLDTPLDESRHGFGIDGDAGWGDAEMRLSDDY